MRTRCAALLGIACLLLAAAGAVHGDGILLPTERVRPNIVVPDELFSVKYHHVSVGIDDQVCITKVDQIFHNDSDTERQGMYVFPMPLDAAITRFSMFAGEQEIVGKIMDKSEARSLYESIVRQKKDPAILEYIDRNTFRAQVYPIPAHGDKRIRLDYTELAQQTGTAYRYVYPLSTERFSSKPLEDCRVAIRIRSKRTITSVYSPTHTVDVTRPSGNEALVTWEAKNTRPDTDLVLYYSVSSDDLGMDLVAHKEKGEEGFFTLLASPRPALDKANIQPKNVVFVLDRTGSMAGEKIDQAKAALKFCVNSLRAEDTFNVITFNESPTPTFPKAVKATPDARRRSLAAIDDMEATGGTNIRDALASALKQFGTSTDSARYVVFLTDGEPTVGVTDPKQILQDVKAANTRRAKLFVFGVGYDVNTNLLDQLARGNHGDTDYVRPRESIEAKVGSFFVKVSEPILSDVKLSFSGVTVSDVYPGQDIPDIFRGSQLIVFGRYKGAGPVKVELSGIYGGTRKTFTLSQQLPDSEAANSFMPQLWASRKIGYLLDEIRLHSNQELVDEVVRLSRDYGIPTEYTSFFVDDRNASADAVASASGARERFARANKATTGTHGVAQSANSYGMRNQTQMPQAVPSSPAETLSGGVASPRARAAYQDEGDQAVVVSNVQNVARRTFYQRGKFWEDAGVQPNQKFIQIKQFSDAHFRLLEAYPRLAQYSSLGNVRLVLENKQAIEVGPQGKEQLSETEVAQILKGVKLN